MKTAHSRSLNILILLGVFSIVACNSSEFDSTGTAKTTPAKTSDETAELPSAAPTATLPGNELGNGSEQPTEPGADPASTPAPVPECNPGQPGLGGKVYTVPNDTTSKLPDFSLLTPIAQVNSDKLDVPKRDWTAGFPGMPSLVAWFAIVFDARIKIPQTGLYNFKTTSDDGSKLFIDSMTVPIVNNDGWHPTTTVETKGVQLTAGEHLLRVEWYQGPPTALALQVYWQQPGKAYEIIPTSVLTHGSDCSLPNIGKF